MIDYKVEIENRFLQQKEYLGSSKVVNSIEPIVTVCVTTYQHVNFLKICLDNILNQKVNFDYEIIIGEDCSTDGTRELCIEYANRHPDKIRLFLRDRKLTQLFDSKGNIIKRLNGIFTRMSARGKYIAICEGDDYWTDPLKLQKQVDFLENNSQCVMCFHNAVVKYDDINKNSHLFNYLNKSQYINPELIFNNWIIPTASIVYSSDISKNMPEWSSKIYSGDYTLSLIALNYGKIYSINESMSVYRVTYSGTSASSLYKDRYTFVLREQIKLFDYFNEYSNYKFNRTIRKRVSFLLDEIKFIEVYRNSVLKCIFFSFSFFVKKIILKIKRKLKTY